MNKYKNIFLIVISFILGCLVMFLLIKPLYSIERTQIYEKSSLNKAISKIYDATVSIETYNGTSLKNTGTGFFYKKDNKYSYIITNEHVISDGDDVRIITTNDEEVKTDVLGSDEYLDLAILRVDKKYAKKLAIIGNSKNTKIGDTIFVVGSPLGRKYNGTVTSGILSGKNRIIETETTNDKEWLMNVIQFDASINPGNSGGPLLNINGEVIGICSLKLVDKDVEGMSFAIPIEYAMNYIEPLEKKEEIKYIDLGIKMTDTNDTSSLLKLGMDINIDTDGVLILEVEKNSIAKKAGLKEKDIITKINNKIVKNTTYLKYELYQYKEKDEIEINYIREGKEKKTKAYIK